MVSEHSCGVGAVAPAFHPAATDSNLRAGIAAYALQAEDEGTRTQGDLKVTPEGRIYFYNKSGARWLRERQNIKLKL